MTPDVKKAIPARLRSLSLDERWLQDRIEEDPSLLRLGDLQMVRREKAQPSGGRVDFILYDPEEEVRYEVEVMLGVLDESHIIRTIEYWDIERQRYPSYDHRAVIVAEEITARFFNVIRLLNRAVPLIALQLDAFTIGDDIVLHVTKVLDVYEEAEPEDDLSGAPVDRRYWETRSSPPALAVLDKLVGLVQSQIGQPRVTYNKNHIALGTTGHNFCWLHPPREASHLHFRVRCWGDTRDEFLRQLGDTPLYARPFRGGLITLKLSMAELELHKPLVLEILRHGDRGSKNTVE
ncbi:MAG: hypothetical protein ACYC7F_05225 [Gemmatimonadaceae bacterium]